MGGDEGKHLMLFPGIMLRQGNTGGHAYSLLGFSPPPPPPPPPPAGAYPPHPGAYAYARPGGAYAYAQAHTYAYPPPAGPYAYPPQGYPQPGAAAYPSFSAPNQGHEASRGGGQHTEMEPQLKAGGAGTAAASAYCGAVNNPSRGHGRPGAFGSFGNWLGYHSKSSKHAGHSHKSKFKHGHRPGKFEHVHGKFCSKCTKWK